MNFNKFVSFILVFLIPSLGLSPYCRSISPIPSSNLLAPKSTLLKDPSKISNKFINDLFRLNRLNPSPQAQIVNRMIKMKDRRELLDPSFLTFLIEDMLREVPLIPMDGL